jgi:AcrR family transcriptional regulator
MSIRKTARSGPKRAASAPRGGSSARPRVPLARPPLTRDEIARAALALIDRDGLAALSMRTVGRALGVEAMAVYHHFAGKADLLDAVADRLVAEIGLPALAAPGDWIGWLRALAHAYRAMAARHPEAFPLLALRRFNSPAAFGFLDRFAQVLSGAGFDAAGTARVFRLLGFYLNGAALADIAIRGAPVPAGLDDPATLAAFPHLRALGPHLGPAALDATFAFGLEELLARVAALPRASPG